MKNPQSETSGQGHVYGTLREVRPQSFHNFLAVFHDFHLVTKTEFSAVSQATHTLPFPMEGGAKGICPLPYTWTQNIKKRVKSERV